MEKILSLASVSLLTATALSAAPISYEGTVTANSIVTGTVSSLGSVNEPSSGLSDYWAFEVVAGFTYTILGQRFEQDFDMALFLLDGVFADDSVFAGDLNNGPVIDFADDEVPRPGPYGDPLMIFSATTTDVLSLVVTNFASGPADGGDDRFFYGLSVTAEDTLPPPGSNPPAIPLPATLPLLLGATGAVYSLRRRQKS